MSADRLERGFDVVLGPAGVQRPAVHDLPGRHLPQRFVVQGGGHADIAVGDDAVDLESLQARHSVDYPDRVSTHETHARRAGNRMMVIAQAGQITRRGQWERITQTTRETGRRKQLRNL